MTTRINKVLLALSVLLLSGLAFAGHHQDKAQAAKTVVGFDTTSGAKESLYAGSLETVEIWSNYMKAHDDSDFAAIRVANAADFKAYVADGSVIENTDVQIELLKDWFGTSNPKWTHRYSIANELVGEDGKLQQWVTTGWELTETTDGMVAKRQEIFDVLIENGKIKTIYIAARVIPNEQ
jgi:hypothetical protein